MTKGLFAALDVYQDAAPQTAAMNMAIDEALLEQVTQPSIRSYRWDHPALSFGYFGKFIDVSRYAVEHDIVRRWTGGGIVFHGNDLTYSVIIPGNDPLFAQSPTSVYEKIHQAIRDALAASGQRAELAEGRDAALRRSEAGVALRTAQRAVPTNVCFASPVLADVMVNGQKVAGAAQRRTRRGLLQQGSIQEVVLGQDFEMRFADHLSKECVVQKLSDAILERASEIAAQKYGTEAWLRKR
jgi:lipoate-protein ligase A